MELKKILSVISISLCVVLLGTGVAFSEELGGELKLNEEKGVGLKETTDWIKSKVDNKEIRTEKDSSGIHSDIFYKINISFTECTVEYTVKMKQYNTYSGTGTEKLYETDDFKYEFDMSRLHANEYPRPPQMDQPSSALLGSDNNIINCKGRRTLSDSNYSCDPYSSVISIYADSLNTAERVAKAFKHAIEICNKRPAKRSGELF